MKKLKAKAENNTMVTVKSERTQEVKKSGVPLDHTVKRPPCDSPGSKVGVSLGVTLNMDNFESLRIDCWLSDDVRENETQEQAYARVSQIVQDQLSETIKLYRED